MKTIGDFTDSERVRGVMGFTERDLSDDQILSMQLNIELSVELYKWFPTSATSYDTWYNGGSPTAEDQNNINLLLSYCTYQAAYLVSLGLEMIAQRSVTDSKMTMSRYSNVDLPAIRDRMQGRADSAKATLASSLSLTLDESVPTLFSSTQPGFDPVVGS